MADTDGIRPGNDSHSRDQDTSMKAKLFVVKGAETTEVPLRLPAVIGRSKLASIKVQTTVVSREHCEIFERNGKLFVRDLQSSNGTFVNDDKIEKPTELADDDLLTVGPVTMRAVQEPSVHEEKPSDSENQASAEGSEKLDSVLIVDYQETTSGSFVGIDDSMLPDIGAKSKQSKEESRAPSSSQEERSGETDESVVAGFFDADKAEADRIDAEDSSLNNFFDNLD